MAKTKVYFWLKFDKKFFENIFIKQLKGVPGGYAMTVIYIRLMLESLESDCVLYYEGYFDSLKTELAIKLDVSEDDIDMTVAYFTKCGLIQIDSDGNAELPQAKAMLEQESNWARYKREQRKISKLDNVQQMSNHCPIEIEKEIEKEEDIEIEVEEEKENSTTSSSESNSLKYFFEKWQEYTGRAATPFEIEDIPKLHKEDDFSIELMLTALREAVSSTSNFNFNYFKSILMRYKRQGLLTPEMVAGAEEQRQEAKSKQYDPQPAKSNVPSWSNPDYKPAMKGMTREEFLADEE